MRMAMPSPPRNSKMKLRRKSVEWKSVDVLSRKKRRKKLSPKQTLRMASPSMTFWKITFSGRRWMMLLRAKESVTRTTEAMQA